MSRNRNTRTCLLALLLVVAPALAATTHGTGSSPDPHALFNAMRAASGGERWSRAGEIDCEGILRQGKLSGPRRTRAGLRHGRYLVQADVGIRHGTRGFDGAHAWMRDEKGLVSILDGPQARREAATQSYIARRGWFTRRHASMKYLGNIRKHGHRLERIEIHPDGGVAFEAWIHAGTHLLESLHMPDDTGRTITTRYTDYRTVDGLRLSFVQHIGNGEAQYDRTLKLDRCQVLPEAVTAHFTAPASSIRDARITGSGTQATVPFQSYAGLILVPLSINGKPPMPFILDSGGLNLLTPDAARELGLEGKGNQPVSGAGNALQSLQVTHVAHYRLGRVELDAQRFLITPLPLLLTDRGDKPPIAGLVGYELLRRFTTRIDYVHHTLTFSTAGGLHDADGADVLPLTFDERTPQIRMRVDGAEGVFTLDTGASNTLTLFAPFASAHGIALAGRTGTSHASNVGGVTQDRSGRIARIGIGPYSLNRPDVDLSAAQSGIFASGVLGGNIGQGILSRFTLTLDYQSRRIRLQPNMRFEKPFADDKPSSGFALNRLAHDRFQVIAVKAGSPAGAAGLVAGDSVVALDGMPARDIGLVELKAHLHAAAERGIDLTVLRDGRRKRIHIGPPQTH